MSSCTWTTPGTPLCSSRDRSRVVLRAWSWDGVAATFAMFGVPLRVVGPPELAHAMHRLAARVTAAVTA